MPPGTPTYFYCNAVMTHHTHPLCPAARTAHRHPALHPVALAAILTLWGTGLAHAQANAQAAPQTAGSLPPVTVSASGLQLGANEMTTPTAVLEGDELVRRREATLGETLGNEPGITSSHFGAGAGRPIIRGMDGPRVKVLSDGAELHDASTISPDHAVVSEPMLATQIEVLRGPSALVYGNGAVGGVVNVLDGKVPTAIPQKGYEGSAELRANTGAREGAGALSLTGGAGNLAVHVEGVARDAGDYRVGKGWAPEGEATRKVPGSFNRTDTGSVGLSWVASAATWARPTRARQPSTACRGTTTALKAATPMATICIAAPMRAKTMATTMKITTMAMCPWWICAANALTCAASCATRSQASRRCACVRV